MAGYSIVYKYAGHTEYQIMAASLCVMRIVRPELFAAAKKGPIPYSDAKRFLRIDNKWRKAEDVDKCWREFAGDTAVQGQYSWGSLGSVSAEETVTEARYRRIIAKICDTIDSSNRERIDPL